MGIGAFGRVVKAEAIGLVVEDESVSTTVAVKMPLSSFNFTAVEFLVSELKIHMYLGSYVNVVRLLGACTTNVPRGFKTNKSISNF